MMIELEVAWFLLKAVLSDYLGHYSEEAIIFIFVLSVFHLVARLFKSRRGGF